jgi:hypothetical protein
MIALPPTAMHVVLLGQDTPANWVDVVIGSVGSVQLEPKLPVTRIDGVSSFVATQKVVLGAQDTSSI